VTLEWRDDDFLDERSRVADCFELADERMGGIDFVAPVRADHEQVPHIRLGQEVLEDVERRCVEPLQIVEEQGQWVLRPREHGDEPPEDELETPLRVLRRNLGDWRLLPDDELQLGDEIDHQPSVRAQRFV
jgi:hypothetical protein